MISVIFGAGATTAFIPSITSGKILEAIQSQENWDKVIRKIPDFPKRSCYIKRNAMRIIDATKSEKNFERIVEICDRVAGFYSDRDCDSLFNKAISIIHHQLKNREKSFAIIPFLIREIIADYFLNEEKKVASSLGLGKKEQKNFIEHLCAADKDIALISLNYDTFLFKSLTDNKDKSHLSFGISHHFTNRDSYGYFLNEAQFLRSKRVLIFPHGSLFFNRLGMNRLSFDSNPDAAESARWKGLEKPFPLNTSVGQADDFAPDFNSFIVSGQTKSLSVNKKPYDMFYFKMIASILQSDTIIIIGYSFHDSHVNNLLKNTLLHNSKTRILIVDFQDKFITNIELIQQFESLFEIETRVRIDSSSKKSFEEDPRLCEIEKNKEGWLLEERIYYYCKGYSAFLKDYSTILKKVKKKNFWRLNKCCQK